MQKYHLARSVFSSYALLLSKLVALFLQEMKGWLEEMVAKLVEAPRSHHQFISAMAVACCIVKCHIPHSLKMKNFVIPLLNMLNLQPDIRERAMYLKDIPTDFR